MELLALIFYRLLDFYGYVLLGYCILSFLPRMDNGFVRIIEALIEPVLSPIRSLLFKIPQLRGLPVDLSPVALFLLIRILRSILESSFYFVRMFF